MRSVISVIPLIIVLGAATAQVKKDTTRFSGTKYSNTSLGFRYTPPRGMVDRTEPFRSDIREQAKASGTINTLKALLAMSSGVDDSATKWGSVTIETYPRKAVSESNDVKAEVQMSAWVAHSHDESVPPQSVVISGQRFSVSLFAVQEGAVRKGAVVWTTVRKGELLSFVFAANSPDQLKALAESMKTLQFF